MDDLLFQKLKEHSSKFLILEFHFILLNCQYNRQVFELHHFFSIYILLAISMTPKENINYQNISYSWIDAYLKSNFINLLKINFRIFAFTLTMVVPWWSDNSYPSIILSLTFSIYKILRRELETWRFWLSNIILSQ